MQTVSSNPIAIGYASLASVKDNVKTLTVDNIEPTTQTIQDGSYKMQRNFVLVTKSNTALSEAAQNFYDFATSEAADEFIINAGEIPVKR